MKKEYKRLLGLTNNEIDKEFGSFIKYWMRLVNYAKKINLKEKNEHK